MSGGPSWRSLRRQLISEGGSLPRALLYLELDALPPLDGIVLDIGAGVNDTYWRHLALKPKGRRFRVDLVHDKRPEVVADAERGLPFHAGSVDAVVMMYVLEHVYDYRGTIAEVKRVLRPGGILVMAVPFLLGVHREGGNGFFVDDFFRYSASALRRLLSEGGEMSEIRVVGHGGLFMTVLSLLQPMAKSHQVFALAAGVAVFLDRVLDRRFPENRDKWVMGYLVVARKASR